MLSQHLVGAASQQQKLQPQLLQPHQDYDQLVQYCKKKTRQEIHALIGVVIIAVESNESNNKQTGGRGELQTPLDRCSLLCYKYFNLW